MGYVCCILISFLDWIVDSMVDIYNNGTCVLSAKYSHTSPS